MTTTEAKREAESEAAHVFDYLLPEIRKEHPKVVDIVYLIASLFLCDKADRKLQLRHLSKLGDKWPMDLVNQWAYESMKAREHVIARFVNGCSLESLERELTGSDMPRPMTLVRRREDLKKHLESLLALHGEEVSYYDYVRGTEGMLVCVVMATVWQ